MLTISGRVRDSSGMPVAESVSIRAFEQSALGRKFDRHLGAAEALDGKFSITVSMSLGVNPRKVYLVVTDPHGRLASVTVGEDELAQSSPAGGAKEWRSGPVQDIGDVDVVVSLRPRATPGQRYEAVVVGSGFGGTIAALTLANKFAGSPEKGDRVCVLERGQWWLSGDIPATSSGTTDGRETLRQYLDAHGSPYSTWPSSDDLSGLLRVVANSRTVDPVKGVYDYLTMKNVSVLSASGVGGGSLIYFNLTARPDPATYADWAVQKGNDRPLDGKYSFRDVYGEEAARAYFDDPSSAEEATLDYFDIARNFLGVNKVTTTAALGRFRLRKTEVFQEAAHQVNLSCGDLMNDGELDADLSITDVPEGTFGVDAPTRSERIRLSSQANVCQREGRCGLGCIPDARHTMGERLYEAISEGKPIDVFPLCQVESIEENDDPSRPRYSILLTDYSDDPKGVQRTIQAKTVVLAAGTLGSTGILLRSKGLRKSRAVGKGFSTNGDTFGIVSPTKEVVDPGRGPLLTSIARYRHKEDTSLEFSLEDLGVPKMFGDVLPPLLAAMNLERKADSVVPQTNVGDFFKRHVTDRMGDPQKAEEKVRAGLDQLKLDAETMATPPGERLQRTIVLFGMGRDRPVGQLVEGDKGALTLDAPYDLGQEVYDDIVDRMRLFAREVGRDGEANLTIPFWDERAKLALTAHPLGGCPMGLDAADAVVDGVGRVYAAESGTSRHEGLYVVDGSIIPTSLGVNPSLTICALAFRISEEIAGDKRFWPSTIRAGDAPLNAQVAPKTRKRSP